MPPPPAIPESGFAVIAGVPSILRAGDPTLTHPEVSIMIPAFRRLHLLDEAIRSALAQRTRIPFEVVVVDNDAEAGEERGGIPFRPSDNR